MQDLQKRLELVEIEKKTAENILDSLKQENEKIELEKEAYQNLVIYLKSKQRYLLNC